MMRSIRKCRKIIPLFLLILMIFTSCTDGGAGIFYSIEIEEEIKNRSLPDYLTAFSYATTSSDSMYYLAGGGLYRWDSLTPSQEWSDLSLPSGWKYTWQVASNGTDTLYVILENSDGDRSALYSWDGTDWQKPIVVWVGRPYRLWFAENELYVATQETANETDKIYNYRLYHADDASNLSSGFSQVTVGGSPFVSSNKPIRDLDAIPAGDFFFITSAKVYSGTDVTFNESVWPNRYLRKLHYSPLLSSLFLSAGSQSINGSGYVYKWNGVDDWDFVDSVGDDPNDFEDVTFGGSDYLLIGTENGYYESSDGNSFTGESATIESASKYEITDLSSAVVQGLFDGPGNIFFAMTSGNGLWRNTAGTWSRE
ncbi:hypothetical protein B4O97_03800 [Marispirochaeta aestuarii]|uniref:Uncharacterized protein n=1 Tax=Marispirochaeta aestuarii TaxID=1963862 RepID=A0A1Y1S2M7_9SPIO|nr:hypothetical protein [Marispirochaeta aestuarii]ORC37326.1 hypothetical protein B4O97_03800 [Marispirochaeta aestuarii]